MIDLIQKFSNRSYRQARRLTRKYGVFWIGAIIVGLVAVLYARLIDFGFGIFQQLAHRHVWLPLLLTPAASALAVWLTRRYFRGSEGSGIPQVIAYSAAKSAYLGMVRTLATEVSAHGVRINAIAPGGVSTPILGPYWLFSQ